MLCLVNVRLLRLLFSRGDILVIGFFCPLWLFVSTCLLGRAVTWSSPITLQLHLSAPCVINTAFLSFCPRLFLFKVASITFVSCICGILYLMIWICLIVELIYGTVTNSVKLLTQITVSDMWVGFPRFFKVVISMCHKHNCGRW